MGINDNKLMLPIAYATAIVKINIPILILVFETNNDAITHKTRKSYVNNNVGLNNENIERFLN